ncbi:hypothetical protein E1A91_D12G140100v1 [Gossypium mustelinum]|uniref:Uncharacterized protein n=1 Tax=Gossypium mustelinum TaxID=34275 RepID=A0A5D2SE65_GOSMU|nr:hypothetical protein E1A91_D12G140100v1 [Gossypium mustelinum]
MHSPYSAGPPPNGRLVARNAITARFGYGAITSIGCNSHSLPQTLIRDSFPILFFYSILCPHQAFVPSILPRFPSRGLSLTGNAIALTLILVS